MDKKSRIERDLQDAIDEIEMLGLPELVRMGMKEDEHLTKAEEDVMLLEEGYAVIKKLKEKRNETES